MNDDLTTEEQLYRVYSIMRNARENVDWEHMENKETLAFDLVHQWETRIEHVIGEGEETIRERAGDLASENGDT